MLKKKHNPWLLELLWCVLAVGVSFSDVWIFGPSVPPGSSGDGKEWELEKCAMFCWRLWTEGLEEQLCAESQHSALNCSSPVNIEVIIEDVFWPLKTAVLSQEKKKNCQRTQLSAVKLLQGLRKDLALFIYFCFSCQDNHFTIRNRFIMLSFCVLYFYYLNVRGY